jgi:hypothetical protein
MNHNAIRALMIFAASALASGCTPSEDTVTAVGVSSGALSTAGGTVTAINGSYLGCSHHADGDKWSLEVDGSGATLDHAAVSVIKNDVNCRLVLEEVIADTLYIGDPAITMDTTWQLSPSAFAQPPGDGGAQPTAFFANAEQSSLSYASSFAISLTYSDDPSGASGNTTANFTVETASASASGVPAPDYTIDLSGVSITTDVNSIVTSASGSATLVDGLQTGESYLVLDSSPGSTYAELDAAFTAAENAAPPTNVAITGADPSITISALDVGVGTDLSAGGVTRYVVVQHVDNATSVPSYELITVTFNKHS